MLHDPSACASGVGIGPDRGAAHRHDLLRGPGGSCAEIGVQQTVRNLEDFFLWLRDVWALARVKLNLCMVTV